MKTKLALIGLLVATIAAIAWYPAGARDNGTEPGQAEPHHAFQVPAPVIDVVFVLDTTGSMSGLIETAKEKIWSIASTMASARPTPQIRIGLVGYRDRGDEYVVRTVDLSQDLDSVYAQLMQFTAGGGGDGPESVNAALDAAVEQLSWSAVDDAYRVIFLVGDAPPHMDYQDERQYPAIVADARQRGIVVNAIQCGGQSATVDPWQQIAKLGSGSYFQVEQGGSAFAVATPFDNELATLSSRLDATRLYFGSDADRAVMASKMAAADSIDEAASAEARARRGVFNLSSAGRANRLGSNELVDAIESGTVALSELETDELPAVLRPMAPEAQKKHVEDLARERRDIESRMHDLAARRSAYIRKQVEEAGGARDSLDQKLYETISRQAVTAGLEYEDGPAY